MVFCKRCPFKMYIPNKPAKYGIKIVMLCDNKSKYMLNAEVYLGKGTNTKELGLAEYFIMNLATPIFGSRKNATMDKWFTFIHVAKKLLQTPYQITIVKTLRKTNRRFPLKCWKLKRKILKRPSFVLMTNSQCSLTNQNLLKM